MLVRPLGMLSGSYATVVLVSKTSWILFIDPAKTNARFGNFKRKFPLEQSKGGPNRREKKR